MEAENLILEQLVSVVMETFVREVLLILIKICRLKFALIQSVWKGHIFYKIFLMYCISWLRKPWTTKKYWNAMLFLNNIISTSTPHNLLILTYNYYSVCVFSRKYDRHCFSRSWRKCQQMNYYSFKCVQLWCVKNTWSKL